MPRRCPRPEHTGRASRTAGMGRMHGMVEPSRRVATLRVVVAQRVVRARDDGADRRSRRSSIAYYAQRGDRRPRDLRRRPPRARRARALAARRAATAPAGRSCACTRRPSRRGLGRAAHADRHRQRRHAVPRRLGHDGARPPRPRRASRRAPVLDVHASADGDAASGCDPPGERDAGAIRRVVAARRGRPGDIAEILDAVRADLERVLADVRAATGDWLKMLAALDAVDDELERAAAAVDRRRARRRPGAPAVDRRPALHVPRLPQVRPRRDADGDDLLRAVPGSGLGSCATADRTRADGHASDELLEAAGRDPGQGARARPCSCSRRRTRARPCTARPTSTTSA